MPGAISEVTVSTSSRYQRWRAAAAASERSPTVRIDGRRAAAPNRT